MSRKHPQMSDSPALLNYAYQYVFDEAASVAYLAYHLITMTINGNAMQCKREIKLATYSYSRYRHKHWN